MVLEYADGGTLFERIRTSKLRKEEIRKIFRDTCQAVQGLHHYNVMHRDIKVNSSTFSQRTFCSQKRARPNCVTSVLPPFWETERLYAAPMSIWLLR